MKINWKKVTVCMGTLFLIAMGSQAVAADNWGEVARRVLTEQQQAEAGAQETERWLKMDQADLKKELENRKADEKKENAELDKLRAELKTLQKKRSETFTSPILSMSRLKTLMFFTEDPFVSTKHLYTKKLLKTEGVDTVLK